MRTRVLAPVFLASAASLISRLSSVSEKCQQRGQDAVSDIAHVNRPHRISRVATAGARYIIPVSEISRCHLPYVY